MVFFKYVARSRSRHVTTKRTMGCMQSAHTFYHPDLLEAFSYDTIFHKWYRYRHLRNDPGWQRNSPLRNELVDLLNDATKAMGGWPRYLCCCPWFRVYWNPKLVLTHEYAACQLVEPFNKVCKKFNDAKLFDMGLQCRAVVSRQKIWGENYLVDGGTKDISKLFVLVEKRSDEKLRDVGDALESHNVLVSRLGPNPPFQPYPDPQAEAALAWSPPEDWMTRLTPPYNEATNHV